MFKKIKQTFRYAKSIVREKIKSSRRSSKWDSVRDTYIATHQVCEACGSRKKVQVHHIAPFHIHPELELEESNLIALCMDENECHLNIGHGDSFRCYNPSVKEDAKKFMVGDKEDRKKIIEEAKKNRKID